MQKKKVDIWYSLTFIPAIILGYNIGKELFVTEDSSFMHKILVSMLGGGLVSALGAVVYLFIKNRSKGIKITTVCIFIATLFYCFILAIDYKNQLLTCEICGYKAVDRELQECDVCMEETWDSFEEKEEYISKLEWIQEGQLLEFSIDDSAEYFFYHPDTLEGYIKDKNWKPSITYEEVLKEGY